MTADGPKLTAAHAAQLCVWVRAGDGVVIHARVRIMIQLRRKLSRSRLSPFLSSSLCLSLLATLSDSYNESNGSSKNNMNNTGNASRSSCNLLSPSIKWPFPGYICECVWVCVCDVVILRK